MKNLLSKILKVQSELKPVIKELDNPYFSSKYFDVNAVIDELMPLLQKHGLVVLQPLSKGSLVTIVADPESGEQMAFEADLPEVPDAQKFGAAITYFRRYSLTSLFLMRGEKDDDANSVSQTKQYGFKAKVPYQPKTPQEQQTILKKINPNI